MMVSEEPMTGPSVWHLAACFYSLNFIFNYSMPVYLGKKKIVAGETEAKLLCPKVRNANQTWYVTSVEFESPLINSSVPP